MFPFDDVNMVSKICPFSIDVQGVVHARIGRFYSDLKLNTGKPATKHPDIIHIFNILYIYAC